MKRKEKGEKEKRGPLIQARPPSVRLRDNYLIKFNTTLRAGQAPYFSYE